MSACECVYLEPIALIGHDAVLKRERRTTNEERRSTHYRFTLTNDQFAVNDSRIRIPHIGWMRMRESLRYIGKIVSATISRSANKWFVSVTVEIPKPARPIANDNQVAVGVDLGLNHFATLSTGEKITGPKPHKA